jgi:hypothetical protein
MLRAGMCNRIRYLPSVPTSHGLLVHSARRRLQVLWALHADLWRRSVSQLAITILTFLEALY